MPWKDEPPLPLKKPPLPQRVQDNLLCPIRPSFLMLSGHSSKRAIKSTIASLRTTRGEHSLRGRASASPGIHPNLNAPSFVRRLNCQSHKFFLARPKDEPPSSVGFGLNLGYRCARAQSRMLNPGSRTEVILAN
jgi:hypothetical protein